MSGYLRRALTDDEQRDIVDARLDYLIRQAERYGDVEAVAELRRARLENALRGFRFDRSRSTRLVGHVRNAGRARHPPTAA